jgi:ATP-dependent DNA helicase recQ
MSMTTFIEQLNSIPFPPNALFLNIRKKACELLPKDKVERDKIYQEIQGGTAVLENEDTLNMYLNSYGNMHYAKLMEAFSRSVPQTFQDKIEIFDWGCGQGIATICFLDFLNYNRIACSLRTIHLIEPSNLAGERAENIIHYFYPKVKVNRLQKTLDELSSKDFEKTNTTKIHLFSNILDVTSFDLSLFIHFFQQTFLGKNYFYCVGPYYPNNKRVDDFVVATAPDEMYGIINAQKGEWKNDWTMALRVFYKNFKQVERLEDIRKRIEDFIIKITQETEIQKVVSLIDNYNKEVLEAQEVNSQKIVSRTDDFSKEVSAANASIDMINEDVINAVKGIKEQNQKYFDKLLKKQEELAKENDNNRLILIIGIIVIVVLQILILLKN